MIRHGRATQKSNLYEDINCHIITSLLTVTVKIHLSSHFLQALPQLIVVEFFFLHGN